MGKFFGTDGFRGEAGVSITAAHAFEVGKVLGWYFGARRGEKCRAVIGKDTRLSSYMLEYALAAGLTSVGADAYILHVTTTASVSYVTRCDGFDCGVMISASHNPYRDNGIKILNAQGEKLEDSVISLIERYLCGDYSATGGEILFASGKKIGRTVDYIAGRNRYIGHLISLSTCSYKGLKIALDGANGSAFFIARNVFEALGAKTFAIGDKPDGSNINGGVGSTHIRALQNLVFSCGADVGFAFDGDADRCIAVDENGREVSGDGEMYIAANHLKSRGELVKCGIVCTVLSNGGLIESLSAKKISCEICGVGDRNVCENMSKTGLVLGGERSGHIVFSKYENTGDGLVTAIMLMEALVESKGGFSDLLKGYRELPQVTADIPVHNKNAAADGVKTLTRSLSQKHGVRVVVRPSGTERVVRVMVEGENGDICRSVCEKISNAVKENDLNQ